LIDLPLEIPHKPLKCIHAIWDRQRVLKKLEKLFCQLMP